MGIKEKLRARFLTQPKGFTYQELSRLLKGFGYLEAVKGKTSGFRMMFFSQEKEHAIIIHKPDNIIKSYVMKYVLQELKTIGFIEKDDI